MTTSSTRFPSTPLRRSCSWSRNRETSQYLTYQRWKKLRRKRSTLASPTSSRWSCASSVTESSSYSKTQFRRITTCTTRRKRSRNSERGKSRLNPTSPSPLRTRSCPPTKSTLHYWWHRLKWTFTRSSCMIWQCQRVPSSNNSKSWTISQRMSRSSTFRPTTSTWSARTPKTRKPSCIYQPTKSSTQTRLSFNLNTATKPRRRRRTSATFCNFTVKKISC